MACLEIWGERDLKQFFWLSRRAQASRDALESWSGGAKYML